MRRFILATVAASLLALVCGLPSVAGPVPPFTQCPAVGADTSCSVLITVNPGGGLSFASDPTQGPFDGIEDTLVGVLNSSGAVVSSISLNTASGASIPIFSFDKDGACSGFYTPSPSGCPFDATGYAGSDNLGNADSFSGINAALTSGNVVFGGGGLAAGGTAWFSLEGPPTGISGVSTPEPTSLLLMGSGLMGLLLKKRSKA